MGERTNIHWLRQRLGADIETLLVQGDRPLSLDDPSCAYVTLSDQHQLFCVGFKQGQPCGRREHLAQCPAGTLLFGIEPPSSAAASTLLLSGVSGSAVWRVPAARLLALVDTQEDRTRLAALLEGWVQLLIASLPDAPIPTRHLTVPREQSFVSEPQRALRAGESTLFWAHASGAGVYAGIAIDDAAPSSRHWPLTERAWLLCDSQTIQVRNTRSLLDSDPHARFVAEFGSFILGLSAQRREQLAELRMQRDAASDAAEQVQLQHALHRLVAADSDHHEGPERFAADSFTHACAHILQWLDLPAPPRALCPKSLTSAHIRAALDRIPNVRTRGVVLEPGFFRHDVGPLLAFMVDGPRALRPVALFPRKRGYELYDPQDGRRYPLDDARLSQLHPQAYQFYRSLPALPLSMLQLMRFSARGVRNDLVRIAAVGFGNGLVATLVPVLTGLLYDRIIPGAERGLLLQLVLMLLGVYLGAFCFDAAQGLALLRVQTRTDATLEAAVWDRLLRLPLPFFRNYSAGDLAMRLLGIGSLRAVLSNAALSGVIGGIFSLWNLGLLFYLNLQLAFAACALILLAAAAGALAARSELRYRRQLSDLDGKLRGLLLQLFSGIAKLRVAGAENRAFFVWAALFIQRRTAAMGVERVGLSIGVFQAAFTVISNLFLYWLVTRQGTALHTGEFLAFNAAFGACLRAVLALMTSCVQALQALALYERARPILATELESHNQTGTLLQLRGEIELSHVSFRYAAGAALVLDDVSLQIASGELVAIVGASGSGKSTLLRLLLGFESPVEGAVYYDGQALSGLDARTVRQQIGVVLQHSQVMPGDIFTNIVGMTGLTLEDAWHAARQALLDKEIEALPMGMHTLITAGGGTLSGGQRQRLLIARALANRPKLLFFDEATSALDNQTQAQIRDNLDALRVTRVVIAHRLSTVRNADRIIVMERGRIVQIGQFDELLATSGPFRRIASRQLA